MATKEFVKDKKRYLLWIISALFVVGAFIFAACSTFLPVKYLIIGAVLLVAISAGLFFLQKKWSKGSFALAAVVEVILIAVSCYGMSVLYHATHMMSNITEPVIETDSVSAYVLKNSQLQSIQDAADLYFGVAEGQGEEAVNQTIEDWQQDVNATFKVQSYADLFEAADALKNKEVQVLVLNDAYAGIISGVEGYEWFDAETRTLLSVVTEVEIVVPPSTEPEPATSPKEEPEEMKEDDNKNNTPKEPVKELPEEPEAIDWNALVNQEILDPPEGTFVAYISGIDTWGSTAAKSRSDVNILAVVNTNTKQILLVSTPRDYYVPLSNSHGVKDKLTHAGIYGVNTSMETLEMLYGVEIEYYIRLNFTGFVGIIDALGGIDVYSDSDFSVGDAFSYSKGINHLSGIEALAFARERYSFAGGDRARGTHQMEVIKAVVNKCASSAILYNYAEVMNSMSGCFSTNMSQSQIAALVRMQLNDMSTWSVSSISVDGTGASKTTFTVPNKRAYVMIPDENTVQAAKDRIAEVIQ